MFAQIDIKHYEEEFKKDIEERVFVELGKKFEESKFDEMADLLGDNAVLTTPQGKRLKGKGNLSKFWKKEKEEIGVTDVKFNLKYHYVTEVADPIEQGEDTIDAVGHAIIDYHLISPKEGGTTNKTGTLTLSERHPRRCVWR